MTDGRHPALLPAGLADVLPPEAGFEAQTTEALIGYFERCGYARVKPPLIEFEDNLISGSGTATAAQTFRLMDPISQRMLGVRPDMTVQVARIAATRMAEMARPLRLSYAGQVLRVKGSPLRPERQFGQVGAELIGSDSPEADSEVILMAADAMSPLGVENLSVDLGTPSLIAMIADDIGIPIDTANEGLRAALNQKDSSALAQWGDRAAQAFGALLDAVGPADMALEKLKNCSLPSDGRKLIDNLSAVIDLITAASPNLTLTVDPVEIRGYEYHTGVTFTFFAFGGRSELGRGGRYLADTFDGESSSEPATGITIFLDSLLHVLPKAQRGRQIYLPHGVGREISSQLRDEGWITVPGLTPVDDTKVEARRLVCSHVLIDGTATAISEDEETK